MQMSGERTIAADRATVWSALNDPEMLKTCIPGCQEMAKTWSKYRMGYFLSGLSSYPGGVYSTCGRSPNSGDVYR